MDIEEFAKQLFKEMTKSLITELRNITESAEKEGLIDTPEYKEFIQDLSTICNNAMDAMDAVINRLKTK